MCQSQQTINYPDYILPKLQRSDVSSSNMLDVKYQFHALVHNILLGSLLWISALIQSAGRRSDTRVHHAGGDVTKAISYCASEENHRVRQGMILMTSQTFLIGLYCSPSSPSQHPLTCNINGEKPNRGINHQALPRWSSLQL